MYDVWIRLYFRRYNSTIDNLTIVYLLEGQMKNKNGLRTTLLGESRFAGAGIEEDRYDDEYLNKYFKPRQPKFEHRIDVQSMHGECITIKGGSHEKLS